MNWKLSITDREEPLRICPGQQVEIRDRNGNGILVTAIVPTEHPDELALVLANLSKVSVHGRSAIWPVVAVDRRGLELAIKHDNPPLRLRVEPILSEVLDSGTRLCSLCRTPLGLGSPVHRCNWCLKTYHLECLAGEPRCPGCGRAFARTQS